MHGSPFANKRGTACDQPALLVLTEGITSVVASIFILLTPLHKICFSRQDDLSVAQPATNSFRDRGVWEK
jgi:hypothetical protein